MHNHPEHLRKRAIMPSDKNASSASSSPATRSKTRSYSDDESATPLHRPARRNKPSGMNGTGGDRCTIDEESGYEKSSLSQEHCNNNDGEKSKLLSASMSILHGHAPDDYHVRTNGSNGKKGGSDDTKHGGGPNDPRSRKLFLKTAFWIACWYSTSLATLFLNKIILSRPGSSVHVLGMCQMSAAATLGGFSAHGGFARLFGVIKKVIPGLGSSGADGEGNRPLERRASERGKEGDEGGPSENGGMNGNSSSAVITTVVASSATSITMSFDFVRDMSVVGLLRGLTVALGLIALEHVPVSFVETIKATAPVFTVVFARIILKERTAAPVMASLLPVMAGLILCSAYELRFDSVGFIAALLNNCADCVQNVMSKRLLAQLKPTQLQFYTSVMALLLQSPLLLRDAGGWVRSSLSSYHEGEGEAVSAVALDSLHSAGEVRAEFMGLDDPEADHAAWLTLGQLLLIDAVFYHLQSVSAYCTMGCMSPVSQSVANTLKRSLLVWASILYFGNPVTTHGMVGMVMVVMGVFLYNHARRIYQA